MLSMRNEFKQSLSKFELDNRNTIFIERVVKFNISIPIFGFGFAWDFIKKRYKEGNLRKVISVGGLLQIKAQNPPKNHKMFSEHLEDRIKYLISIRNSNGSIIQSIKEPLNLIAKRDLIALNALDITKFPAFTQPLLARLEPKLVLNDKFIRYYGIPFYDINTNKFISSITNKEIPINDLIEAVNSNILEDFASFNNGDGKTQLLKILCDPYLNREKFTADYANESQWYYKFPHLIMDNMNEFRFVRNHIEQSGNSFINQNYTKCVDNPKIDIIETRYLHKGNPIRVNLHEAKINDPETKLYQIKHLPYFRDASINDQKDKTILKHIMDTSRKYSKRNNQQDNIEIIWNLSGYTMEEADKIENSLEIEMSKMTNIIGNHNHTDAILPKINFIKPTENIDFLSLTESESLIKAITSNINNLF